MKGLGKTVLNDIIQQYHSLHVLKTQMWQWPLLMSALPICSDIIKDVSFEDKDLKLEDNDLWSENQDKDL